MGNMKKFRFLPIHIGSRTWKTSELQHSSKTACWRSTSDVECEVSLFCLLRIGSGTWKNFELSSRHSDPSPSMQALGLGKISSFFLDSEIQKYFYISPSVQDYSYFFENNLLAKHCAMRGTRCHFSVSSVQVLRLRKTSSFRLGIPIPPPPCRLWALGIFRSFTLYIGSGTSKSKFRN